MRKIRPWAMAAACVVIIAGVVFGAPRFFRTGNSSAPASSALNATASASGNSGPADNAAPAEDTADNNAGGLFDYKTESGKQDDSEGQASNDGANSVRGDEPTSASPAAAPVPEPETAPEETEPPALDIDIESSVVTVESKGKSTSEKLNRGDTLIWLRAVIEGRAGGNIDAAKIEIFRLEGTDYEVYIYHDDSKLMGSLTEDLAEGIELRTLNDFAQFEQTVDGVK